MTVKRFKLAPAPPKLKQFATTVSKYSPLLRTGARLASFASHIPGLKPLRAISHVLRGLHLAASLAKGLQQLQKVTPQGKAPSGGSAPSPSPKGPRSGPRPSPSFGRLPPRPPAPKPLPSPRAPKLAQNRPQNAPGSQTAPNSASSAPAPYKPLFPIGPGTPAAFPHWQGDQGAAKPTPIPSASSSLRAPTTATPAAPAKTLARLAPPTMLKRFPTMPGAERRTLGRLPGRMGDSDAGGEGGGLPSFGKGFGGGFGGSDGPGLGGDSDGGADGMGGNVAKILQTISQNLATLLDIAKANGMTPEGGKDAPGMPGGSDALQGAQKIIDTLESGKALVGAVDTGIQWARALGPLIEGVMAAGAPVADFNRTGELWHASCTGLSSCNRFLSKIARSRRRATRRVRTCFSRKSRSM
jgi:hypothetical protein